MLKRGLGGRSTPTLASSGCAVGSAGSITSSRIQIGGFTMTNQEQYQEALGRAADGASLGNYPAIFAGFTQMGIPQSEIKPRENVFTFAAWKALGRHVRKGQHGVKVLTFIDVNKEDKETGGKVTRRRPWSTTVFHISQTAPDQPTAQPVAQVEHAVEPISEPNTMPTGFRIEEPVTGQIFGTF